MYKTLQIRSLAKPPLKQGPRDCDRVNSLSVKIPIKVLLCLILTLLSACQSSQKEAENHALQAIALLEQNRIGEARIEIGQAIQAANGHPRYYLLQAQIEMRANSVEGAFNAYQDAMALDPTNIEALLGVAQLGLQIGRFAESELATSRLLTLNPNQRNALLVAGLIAYVKNRHEEAISYADRLIALSAFDEGGTILWVRTKFIQGDTDEAKAALERFEENAGVTAGSARTRLEIARYERDAMGMNRAFEDIKSAGPVPIEQTMDEANFRFKRGQSTEALGLTREMLESNDIDPAGVDAVLSLWREYDVRLLPDTVLRSVQNVPSSSTRLTVAGYLIETGNLSAAKMLLSGMTSIDADALRAAIALSENKIKKARQEAGAILAKERTQCTALIVHARASLLLGHPGDALRSAQLASSECPNNIDGWIIAAKAYVERDSILNARRMFRDGIEANPQNSTITRTYVNWLMERGVHREALAAARRLTNVAPALSSGWTMYSDLCRKLAANCVSEAERGLEKSRVIYGVDLKPGERPENSLFGRFTAS